MGEKKSVIVSILAATLLASCIFGPAKFKGVIGYRPDGRVFLAHDNFYRVGILPSEWKRLDTKARTISFYNPKYEGSISTDAVCGKGASDRRLDSLGGEIISALEDRVKISEEYFDLDGRGAIRQKVMGKMDGVPVGVDLVVVRKDSCVFDMYLVAPQDTDPALAGDFETFYSGFHYK